MLSFFSKSADIYSSLRFLRLLTTKWEKTNAYKKGIIDKEGNQIIKSSDIPSEDSKYFTLFHRLVFNIKRLLQKTPLIGKSILTNYAAALWMLKEELGIKSEDDFLQLLEECIPSLEPLSINEDDDIQFLKIGSIVKSNKELETIEETFQIQPNSSLKIVDFIDTLFSVPIYKAIHETSGMSVFISPSDTTGCVIIIDEEGPVVTTSAVNNVNIPVVKKSRRYSTFDIDDDVFTRFMDPKIKGKRWKDFITDENEHYSNIRKCVKRGDLVVLRNSKGQACTVRNYKKSIFTKTN